MDDQAIKTEDQTRTPLERIHVRPLEEEDLPFIFSSWLRSYRASAFAKRIKKDVYFLWHQLVVERILARPSVSTIVACLDGHPDVILGFIVFEKVKDEPKIIHYAFVKESFRRMGITKTLMIGTGIRGPFFFSHWTYALDPIFDKNQERMIYDPYRI